MASKPFNIRWIRTGSHVGNRIAEAKFTLDGKEYVLAQVNHFFQYCFETV